MPAKILSYIIQTKLELNFSYMPFINEGGLFIPTTENFSLDDIVFIDLQLPEQTGPQKVEAKVVWITPKNAIDQILPGVGVTLIGANAKIIRDQIKTHLDNAIDMGAYVCGMSADAVDASHKASSKSKETKDV